MTKRGHRCHGKLGLGVIRFWFKLFCGVRCRDAYRAALYEEAKRRKSVFALFRFLPTSQ